ncbi:hypothetical protein BH09PSE5_BH09PSE5_04340 [soil metagenome]
MALPDWNLNWMLYTALAVGGIGAIAGLVAVFMSYTALGRNREARLLDLRLKLGKLESDLREVITELPRTMQKAERSTLVLATARGVRQASAQGWQKEVDEDFATLGVLEAALPAMGGDYGDLTIPDLEARVLAAYQFQSKALRLDSKYQAVLLKDHNRRQQLADDRRALFETKVRNSQF